MYTFDSYDNLEFASAIESFLNANYINLTTKKKTLKINFTMIRNRFYFERNLILNFFLKNLIILKFLSVFYR
jgi:hypothetical protein